MARVDLCSRFSQRRRQAAIARAMRVTLRVFRGQRPDEPTQDSGERA
ncbi:hypothetical protein HDE77_000626 [Rhodanobacter sp. MP7CTX1]|jgi:hypothetical protein|nr:hypothetical protein [Rhodanobacter sp. MP7CTX1]